MAGFMSGFGPAFARSFEAANDRRSQEKQDAFRMVYDDLIKKREKRDEETKEDRKAVAKAKALAASVPGVPEEAWMKAYEWVKSDLSDSQIMENLQTGSFEVGPTPDATASAAAPSAVDTQMAASGIAPAATPEATPTAPASAPSGEVDTGNPITAFLRKKSGSSGDLRREQAIAKIAKSTGASEDDIRAELDGTPAESVSVDPSRVKYTPGAMAATPDKFDTGQKASIEAAQAKTAFEQNPTPQNKVRLAKAEERLQAIIAWTETEKAIDAKRHGVGLNGTLSKIYGPGGYETTAELFQDENGTYMSMKGERIYMAPDQKAEPVSEQELKLIEAARSEVKAGFEDVAKRQAAVEATLGTVARLDDVVSKSQGRVLADLPAGTISFLDKLLYNVGVSEDIVQEAIGQKNPAAELAEGVPVDMNDIGRKLGELQTLNETLMTQDMSNLAVQKGLYETQKAIFTYQLAAAMGQDGKSLAEPERKLFGQLASVGTSPEKFRAAMGGILNNMVDTVDSQARSIVGGSPSATAIFDQYGYYPAGTEPKLMSETLDESDDPTVKTTWGWVRPKGSAPKSNPDETAQPETENIPMVSSPAEAAKLPSGTKFKSPDGKIRIVP